MKVYLVVNYNDECAGVFSSKEKAIKSFTEFMKKNEPTFTVTEIKEVPDYVIIDYSWENEKFFERTWISEFELDQIEFH